MTSRTNRHLGDQPRGGTDDVTPSTLAQRRQLAVQRYLDGDRIETICREMGCAKSWLLSGHRTHLGSGALSASGNHPDQDT
jgi:hypothetical protein